jgi:general secretion pathway protein C
MPQDIKKQVQAIVNRLWVDGLDSRLPVAVTLSFVLLFAYSLAALTWRVIPVPQVDVGARHQPGPGKVHQRPMVSQSLARQINQWHLFGKVEKHKPKAKPIAVVETAPETKLNLKLLGVFASKNTATSRAIIADAKGKEESYSIGDDLPGGASLHEVLSDRIIISHNGRFETLRLPVTESPSSANTSVSRQRNTRTRRNTPTPVATTGETSALLKQYKNSLLNDPQSVMGLLRAQPYKKNGRLAGYRIRPGKDRQLLKRFGLKSGDVVTSVNGVSLDNPIKALEVLRDLSSATQLSVEVERNGSPRSFSFAIDQ